MSERQSLHLGIPEDLKQEIEFTKAVEILEHPYLHLRTDIGDDLYITDSGLPYWRELLPQNFTRDRGWFNAAKVPLPGSSMIFRIPLKGEDTPEVVFKWNRMGTDPMIPDSKKEFNSPFEEFALIAELQSRIDGRIKVQEPLAIYVPSERHTLETLQRRRSLMDFLNRTQSDEHIDMHRDYAVIFRWVDGFDLYQHVEAGRITLEEAEKVSKAVSDILGKAGYEVTDHKMSHIISEIPVKTDRFEQLTLIDFELLRRTANHEYTIRELRRQRYYEIRLQESQKSPPRDPSANRTTIFGKDFIEIDADSSGGRLWVACSTKEMIDYYLPEKWQTTPRQRLSRSGGTYLTKTKDNIQLVVKESRVGDLPVYDPLYEKGDDAVSFGFNSPFEQAAVAAAMEKSGLPAVQLCAIYMINQVYSVADYRKDMSRYESHRKLLGPGGTPVLQEDRQYLTLWPYWEGSDEEMLMNSIPLYEPVNPLMAYHRGIIDRKGKLIRDDTGMPLYRYCNFALVKPPDET